MKHASTSKLICIQLQLVSQINKAKDLFKKQQEWYGHEEKKNNVLLASTKRLLETIILEISWILRRENSCFIMAVLLSKKLYFLDHYASQGTFLAANLKICTNLVVVWLCSSKSESWIHANEVVRESWTKLFVGFLEGLSFAGRVGLTSITGLAKLRNMPHTSKGKSNKMVL